jgi:hypothetical protein
MYFMQEAGEPLRLQYVKHHYGPYAENLRHVLNAVEGHLIAAMPTAAMRRTSHSHWCPAQWKTLRLSSPGILKPVHVSTEWRR